MGKAKLGKLNVILPMVPILVGANVNGKPNYITIGLVGRLGYDIISVSLGHRQYSNTGIRENMTFSVNLPTTAMIKELDYCGSVSGRNVDKSALFDNFYGELKTAPMIKECPINIECRVIQTIVRPETKIRPGAIIHVHIGEINEAYVDENYATEGGIEDGIDISKIDPIIFSSLWPNAETRYRGNYWRLGEFLATGWEIGKELKSGK